MEPSLRLKVSEGTSRPPFAAHAESIIATPLQFRHGMKSAPGRADILEVTAEQVAAFRLSRHHLSKRAPAKELARVAGDMAGAQAQIMSAAQISLWARTRGLRASDVEEALWVDRTLVKMWCLRGTVHIVPSADHALFVRGCTRRANRSLAWMARAEIPPAAVERVIDAIGRVLTHPLTKKELAVRMSKSLGLKTSSKSGRGWGGAANATGFEIDGTVVSLGGILFMACMRGVACSGPNRGSEATFVRPDAWIPRWRDMPVEDAEDELLRRYLRAFGPSTVSDFAVWTYMTALDAREVWARVENELAPVRVNGRTTWVVRTDVPALERASFDRPSVQLLPFFDSFLLGHKDKGHIVDATHYKRVYRPQGWISPIVLVNGRAAAVWALERKSRRLAMRVEPFRDFPAAVRSRVKEEAEDLGRFLDMSEVVTTFRRPR